MFKDLIVEILNDDDKRLELEENLKNECPVPSMQIGTYLDKLFSELLEQPIAENEDIYLSYSGEFDKVVFYSIKGVTVENKLGHVFVLEKLPLKVLGYQTYGLEEDIKMVELFFRYQIENYTLSKDYIDDLLLDSTYILYFLRFLEKTTISTYFTKKYGKLTLLMTREDVTKNLNLFDEFYREFGLTYEKYKEYARENKELA